jgi:hypothetical protein
VKSQADYERDLSRATEQCVARGLALKGTIASGPTGGVSMAALRTWARERLPAANPIWDALDEVAGRTAAQLRAAGIEVLP